MLYGRISLNVVLLLLVNFVSGFRLELMYISLIVSIRSNLTNPHNYFFRLYQKNKSSGSKVKFRQASNHYKRVLEAVKLAYATKAKSSLLPRNLAFGTFGELPIMF